MSRHVDMPFAECTHRLPVEPRRPALGALPLVVRYGVVGAVTQVIYLSVLAAALALQWHYLAGMAVAQVCAIVFAFPTYRARVFRSDGAVVPQFVKFLGVWWVGTAMSFVGVPLLVEGVGLRPMPAQILVLLVVVTMSFFSHRGITFRAHRGLGGGRRSHAPVPEVDL